MSDTLGIYIHIPFCKSKCPYCDFYSKRGGESEYKEYAEQLKDKIKYWGEQTDKTVDTIYIGGGTPSVIGAELICEILDSIYGNFTVDKNAEITMEANPASGKSFDFENSRKSGVNRISLGVQSANINELKDLGRLHTPEDVRTTVQLIKDSGINNISVDLMLGIPEQTEGSLKNSVDFCAELGVTHISSYILKIEENTYYYNHRDKYSFPDDERTADLYLKAIELLAEKGFRQYEISNFARSGFESRHNLKYWKLGDYLGIGPAAHSFMNGRRFYYGRSMEDFYDNKIIDDGEGGTAEEYIMLRLRLAEGLDLGKYKEAFGDYPRKDFLNKVESFCKTGLMIREGDKITLTSKGFLVSNSIISELI